MADTLGKYSTSIKETSLSNFYYYLSSRSTSLYINSSNKLIIKKEARC